MDSKYNLISFNKEFIPPAAFKLELSNRAFRYGDGFFETMHGNGLDIQFIDDHFQRIQKAALILKIDLPEYFTLYFLKEQVAGLLRRCKLFQGARVKLTICRNGEGFYIPKSNSADILIEAFYLSKGPYVLNAEGIAIGIYDEMPKPVSLYSTIKSINAQHNILAGVFAKQNGFDDALLVSDEGNIIEATSSNVFALKGNMLLTPSIESGCVDGIMRKQLLKIAVSLGYNVDANAIIIPDDLLTMDELFLSNAIVGIKSISGFENRRYYKRSAMKFLYELNKMALSNSFQG